MDFNATIDLIIKDLNEAREIIDDLKKYQGVPSLQVELAKSKCKSAADVIATIKTMGDINTPEVNEVLILSQYQPRPESQLKPEPEPQPQPQPQPQPIPIPEPQPIPEPKPQPKPKSQPKLQEDKRPPIIGDSFSHLSNRFNEQLGSLKSDNDVTDTLNAKQIINLTEAIGVNDRFLFIREIFNDNKEAYVQAISRLDKAGSMTDARAVVMSYTGDSNENEAVKQLLDLVKRKLSSNE